MAREVVTNIWCDVCLSLDDDGEGPSEGVYTTATELPPVTIGAMKPRVVALCDIHTKELYEPFKELLTELGYIAEPGTASASRPPGVRSPGSGTFPCPYPDCPKHDTPLKHEQSLRNHMREQHNTTVTEARRELAAQGEEAGPAVEDLFTEHGDPPKVTRAECPECAAAGTPKVYEWPEAKKPVQALGVHRAKNHGVRGKAKTPATRTAKKAAGS